MEGLVAPIPLESQKLSLGDNNGTENVKRPAPLTGGCRIEGYVRVKKVNLPIEIEFNKALDMFALSRIKILLHGSILFFTPIAEAWLNVLHMLL